MSDKKRKRSSVRTESAYQGMDMKKATEKYREMEEKSKGDFVLLKEGWNFFFIMPPWPGSKDRTIWKDVERHGQFVCPRKAADKRCLICEELPRRAKKGDSQWVSEHKLKTRALFNVVSKSKITKLPSNPQAYIKILGISPMLFEDILSYINLERVDISNPSESVVVGINRKGTGFNTRYKLHMGDAIDISKYITSDVMEALHNLDTCKAALPATTKEMRQEVRGAADDDDDFDDSDDIENDEDEELDEKETAEEDEVFSNPDDDDDEEELPKNKSKSKSKKKKVEDDEEDEELDLDDDDDADDDDLDSNEDDDDEIDVDDLEDEEEEDEPKTKKKVSDKSKSSGKKRAK
jgi:hypothetical protein